MATIRYNKITANNSLTGTLPIELSNLPNLSRIYIGEKSSLEGIPSELQLLLYDEKGPVVLPEMPPGEPPKKPPEDAGQCEVFMCQLRGERPRSCEDLRTKYRDNQQMLTETDCERLKTNCYSCPFGQRNLNGET